MDDEVVEVAENADVSQFADKADVEQILSSIQDVNTSVDSIAQSIGTADDFQIMQSHLDIQGKLNALGDSLSALSDGGTDYTSSIDKLCTLLAYGDILMLVLIVLIVVAMGIFTGSLVTKWFKTRG